MGIGSPTLIKSQGNWCLRVVHVFETLSFWFQEKAKMSVSSCIEMSWWRQKTFNTSWLRNTQHRDSETKSHFNSPLHTSRSSLANCSEGASAHASLSSCTAFEPDNLMPWKAEILWVFVGCNLLDAVLCSHEWQKIKNKLLCRARYLKSRPKPQTVSKASENLHYPRVERCKNMGAGNGSSRSPWHYTKEERPESLWPETLSLPRGHLKRSLL